jgi:response regulator RpfG family c-di-GMP phosphodiesterase
MNEIILNSIFLIACGKWMNRKNEIKILVIDDDENLRNTIEAFFEDLEYVVYTADNGRSGIEVFRRKNPDIVLSDLRMPGVDGFEVIDVVRSESEKTPIIVISGIGVMEDALDAIKRGAWEYIMKPIYDMAALEHAVKKSLERAKLIRENEKYQLFLEEMVEERTAELLKEINIRKKAESDLVVSMNRLRQTIDGVVEAIVMAVEIRDRYTAGHQKRVAGLAEAIAREMGIDEDIIDGISVSSKIHDLGKLAVPSEILTKPTRLSETEFDIIKTHAQYGYDILENVEFSWPVAEIVYQHHERIDGSGYPRGLSDGEILLEAKILSVSDVVEAMASHRPYRPSLGIDFALEEIEKNNGKLYDKDVADICLYLLKNGKYELEEQ